jgi:D-threo-aldose 1-dehydrogenase
MSDSVGIFSGNPLSLGTGSLGNLYEAVDDRAARETISSAWEAGIRYFDTAPLYGSGLAEIRLGEVLSEYPRKEFVLSTKVGRLLQPGHDPDSIFVQTPLYRPVFDFGRDAVLRGISESITRLGIDRVDLVYVHDPVDHYREALNAALPTLMELKGQGVIQAVGVGMNEVAPLERFIANAAIDCVLLANRYTLLDQQALARLLPACQERSIAVAVGGALNSGILANPFDHPKFLYRDAPPELVAHVRRLNDVCRSHGVPLLAAALQFTFGQPAVDTVLLGARSPREISAAVDAMKLSIPSELWIELKSQGYIPESAPIAPRDDATPSGLSTLSLSSNSVEVSDSTRATEYR